MVREVLVIRGLLTGLMVLHGLIHAMGFVKGFGWAPLAQLHHPISRAMGIIWLLAGLLWLGAAASLWGWPFGGRLIGGLALALSQAAILHAWSDAKFGTLPNLVLLGAVIHG